MGMKQPKKKGTSLSRAVIFDFFSDSGKELSLKHFWSQAGYVQKKVALKKESSSMTNGGCIIAKQMGI
jgi:hypothetical protein